MALLNTASADNRIVTNGLVLSYSKRIIPGQWSWNRGVGTIPQTFYQAYEHHRYCTKNYMYVGLDLTSAQSVASDAITYYTRSSQTSFWNTTNGGFDQITTALQPMADVSVQQVEGHMYNVIINVREDEMLMTMDSTITPEQLFAYANQRHYDTQQQAFVDA